MNKIELQHLLNELKKSFPNLISLYPKIEITEIIYDKDSLETQINVWHPFIFDNRLIPKEFLGTKVNNLILSSTMPETFNPSENLPLWQVESPTNYINFVEENIDKIRTELKSPTMSKYEALEALTGSFENHLIYWDTLLKKWFE